MKHGNQNVKGYVEDVAYDDNMLTEEEAVAADADAAFDVPDMDDEADIDMEDATSWRPTRKWMAATVIAAAGYLTLMATHGWHLDEHTSIALITLLSERTVSFLLPNRKTPGGV